MAEHAQEMLLLGLGLGAIVLLLLLVLSCKRRRPNKPEIHPNNQCQLPAPVYNQSTYCANRTREEYITQAAYNPNYI